MTDPAWFAPTDQGSELPVQPYLGGESTRSTRLFSPVRRVGVKRIIGIFQNNSPPAAVCGLSGTFAKNPIHRAERRNHSAGPDAEGKRRVHERPVVCQEYVSLEMLERGNHTFPFPDEPTAFQKELAMAECRAMISAGECSERRARR